MIFQYSKRIHYFILIVVCLLAAPGYAAETNGANAHWRQLTSDKAFGYKNQLEIVKEIKEHKPSAFEKWIVKVFEALGNSNFQAVIWSIFGVLAIFIIYKLLLANNSSLFARKKKKVTGEVTAIEQEIEEGDWEVLLQRAVAANDLKQAMRYSYRWLLQMLQDGQLIRYRDDKTNFDYYRELEQTAFKQPFKQLTRHYEYVIYGNYTPTAATYSQYIEVFNQVKKQLGK